MRHMKKMRKSADSKGKSLFSVLANKARLNILFALVGGEKNVTQLEQELGIGQTLVSYGVKRLTAGGFIKVRRHRQFRYYSLNKGFADPFLRAIDPTLKKGPKGELRLRAIITQSPITVIAYDAEGLVTFVSGDTESRFGVSPRKMLGGPLFGLLRSRKDTVGNFRRALSGQTSHWTLARGGRTFDATAVPYKRGRRVVGGICVTHDMSRHAEAEAVLRQTIGEWRSLAEGSPDLIAHIDRRGVILVVNRQLEGLSKERVIGTVLYDYLPKHVRSEVARRLRAVFASGKKEGFRSKGLGRDDAEGMFECRIVPFRNRGKIVAVTFTARDIAEDLKSGRA